MIIQLKGPQVKYFAKIPEKIAATVDPAQTADVTLSGLSTRLAMLKPEDIRLFADLSDIRKPGIYTVPLRCSCSVEGVSVKAVSPGEIKVNVIKLP